MRSKMSLKEWLPLFGITVSAFIFNTSEFMPIGLLTDIADSFHITEAHAGVLITVYSWIVMLLSLPLMLLLNKIDFKRLLLGTIALFGIFQMLSAFSASYGMLMVSRIGVACTHSVFWSIASPAAVSVVSEKFRSLALSMVVTGTSICNDSWTSVRKDHRTSYGLEYGIFLCWSNCIYHNSIYDFCVPKGAGRRVILY